MFETLDALVRRKQTSRRQARVMFYEDLSPHIRCVRLAGSELVDIPWEPGQKVKLSIQGAKASYTPGRVDAASGWMDIVFHLHEGDGPIARWASRLEGGEMLTIFGPKKSMPRAKEPIEWALFLGDETTLGLAQALLEDLPEHVHVFGAIEVDASDVKAPKRLDLSLDTLVRRGDYGDVLREWVDAARLPKGPGVVWLSGHAGTAFGLHQTLKERGVDESVIKLKAYWSDKGHAHRKALERGL